MSDIMLLGILRMPFDLALSTPIAQIQYYQRGVQAADEIEKLRAEVERLRAALREALSGLRYWVPQTARGLVERNRIMQRVEEALEGKS